MSREASATALDSCSPPAAASLHDTYLAAYVAWFRHMHRLLAVVHTAQ